MLTTPVPEQAVQGTEVGRLGAIAGELVVLFVKGGFGVEEVMDCLLIG